MHRDRDTYLLLVTVVPLVFALWMFLSVQATGTTPFGLPTFDIPQIQLPVAVQQYFTVPAGAQTAANGLARHWQIVVPGVLIGLVAGIFIIGGLADLLRVFIRKVRTRRARRPAPAPVEDTLTDLTSSL